MCGVFGYVGQSSNVGATVMTALKALEYRGYDSWGLALATADGLIVNKEVGRINGHMSAFPDSPMGLGHTRWATHGGVTRQNAHPHTDCMGRVAVVHNGIIENHASLKEHLVQRGHEFRSETDSEVVAHLVEDELFGSRSLAQAVAEVFRRLQGHNAIVVMDAASGALAAAKRTSPLVIGLGARGSTIASDAFALRGHADRVIHLEDQQLAILQADSATVLDCHTLLPSDVVEVAADPIRAEVGLGVYPDYLSKEVAEQPDVLRRFVAASGHDVARLSAEMRAANRVVLTGCGTAGNAALAGAYLLSDICGIDAAFVPASEFRYRMGRLGEADLVVALSQSGETLDVLEATTDARRRGARLAAIVNAPNSSLERRVDTRLLLDAGVEQCVLATKSYTAMLAALLLAAYDLAGRRPEGAVAIGLAADAIAHLLGSDVRRRIMDIGNRLARHNHLFVVGRGVHYPSALEAALKIKEVSYVHAEGFAAGELKHGVIALIEPGTPCLVFAPDDETRTDMISGASELRSRGGHIIGVGSTNDPVFDEFIPTAPACHATPIVEAVPGQLLGYAAALARGHDPDRPRNLAKSVTVK
jgi:glucosamine--fructose-6-phosphate aminotransferase (isomerizing)